jgi:hypothetical protein
MRFHLTTIASTVAIFVIVTAEALAAPATTADLSGKKICWDNGNVGTYSAGGKYSSTMVGTGTWRVTSVGIELHTQGYSGYQDVDKRPDGTFNSALEHGGGHYCK